MGGRSRRSESCSRWRLQDGMEMDDDNNDKERKNRPPLSLVSPRNIYQGPRVISILPLAAEDMTCEVPCKRAISAAKKQTPH